MSVKQHIPRTGLKYAPRKFSQQLLERVRALAEEDLWDLCCDDIDLHNRRRHLEE